MADPPKVLIAGESWVTHSIHQKGVDSFTTTEFSEGVGWLRSAIQAAGFVVDYLPGHLVPQSFPATIEALAPYAAVILSDIGANSLALAPQTFSRSQPTPDRLAALQQYVRRGGALVMVGGYLSFQGIEGKARYRGTAVEDTLPVTMLAGDDRVEVPQAVRPQVVLPDHPIVAHLPRHWPSLLGYNRLLPKQEAQVLVRCGEDPLVVVSSMGAGRAMAFASDCGPHWAPQSFVNWSGYRIFWANALAWLTGHPAPAHYLRDQEGEEERVLLVGLQRAQRETIACMQELKQHLRTGMSEIEVRDLADSLLRARGSSGPWCPILVAFGENTRFCDPAHPPSSRTLRPEDVAVIDLTPVFDGFYGDYSETVAWGGGGDYAGLVRAAYDLERAVLAHAGMCSTPKDLFAYAQDHIARSGYRLLDPLGNIGHSIGQLAFLEGFVEAGNSRLLKGGWTIEPFIGDHRAGAKFEDILHFAWDGVTVVGTSTETD